jgi:competence ComEA-like helix-hairpin-helix protein
MTDADDMMNEEPGQEENPDAGEDRPSLRAFEEAKRRRQAAQEGEPEPASDHKPDKPPSSAHPTPPSGTTPIHPLESEPASDDVTPSAPEQPKPPPEQPTQPKSAPLDVGSRDRYSQPIQPREVRLDEHGFPLPPGSSDPAVRKSGETQPSLPAVQPTRPAQAPLESPPPPPSSAESTSPHGYPAIQPAAPLAEEEPAQPTEKKVRKPRKPVTFGSVVRLIFRLMLWGLGIGLIGASVAAGAAVFYYIQIINTVDFPSGPDRFQQLQARALQFETTRIYDGNGQVLYEINDPSGGRRDYVTLDEVSPWVIHATVATEDENFFTNPGFSIPAIVRAVYQAYQEGEVVSGASTITQQLTRALLLPPEERSERTIERKIKEIFISAELSRRFTKEEILELYLNQIYYGNLAYGIEAASQTYFDKPASQLNLAEGSFLAGIPQTPALWDPVTNLGDPSDPNAPPGVLDRHESVVRLMVTAGGDGCVGPMADNTVICVSRNDISANAEDFIAIRNTEFKPPSYNTRYPHWTVYVQQELEAIFDAESIYTSGYDVYTTLDPFLQDLSQEQVEQQLASLAPEKNVGSAAVVAIDPNTGAIRAMVGSRDFEDESIDGQVNVAIIPRQPGSSIKPIVYLAAFEQGWTPATIIWDVPIEYEIPGFGVYAPINYDDRFHGPETVRSSLGNSYNTPAVQALDFAGIPVFLQKSHDLGITSLGIVNINTANELELETMVPGIDGSLAIQIVLYRETNGGFDSVSEMRNVPGIDETKYQEIRSYLRVQEYGLAASLGAGEVSPLEMASAFSVMANEGVWNEPYAIQRIELDGEIVYQHPQSSGMQAIPADDAYLISSILSDHEARTPAFGANSILNAPFNAAAKTGTTNDFRDNWTVGYHPNLAVAVWVGNPDNTQMVDISGVTGAGPIWRNIMEGALERYPSAEFVVPPTIFTQTVCNDSGTIPSQRCLARTHEEQFSQAHPPPSADEDIYRDLEIDAFTGLIANEFCPDFSVKGNFVVVPSHAREWLLNDPQGIAWAEERGIKPEEIIDVPEEECSADTSIPDIAIASPAEFEWVEGNVRVVGTADVTDFSTYIVQIGRGQNPGDDEWILVQGDTSVPVHNGVLAVFDTPDFEEGMYTIRLVVFDVHDNEADHRVTVNLAHPEEPEPEEEEEPPPDEPEVTQEPSPEATEEPTEEPSPEVTEEPSPEVTEEPPATEEKEPPI